MKRIRIRRRTWGIPITIISGAAVIGGSIAFAVTSTSKNEHVVDDKKVYLNINEQSLNILSPIVLKPNPLKIENVTIPGLNISYNENHEVMNSLESQITQAVFKKDLLFFLQGLMNKKSPSLEMEITEPIVTFNQDSVGRTINVSASFKITFQNKTKFNQYYYLNNDLRSYSIKESYETFEYSINGVLSSKLFENNIYGYEVIGKSTITDSKGKVNEFVYNQPSLALNTKVVGFSNSIGYLDVESVINAEMKNLSAQSISNEIYAKQAQDFQLIKTLSVPAQNLLKNIAANETIEKFLADSTPDILELFDLLTTNSNIPYKETIMALAADVLQNKSLAKIIFENSTGIKEIVSKIAFLEPFMVTINEILGESEENIKGFLSTDLISILNSLNLGDILNNFPGILDLIPRLGSDEGLLTVLTSGEAIPLISSLLTMIPGFSAKTIVNDLLMILALPDSQILNKPILDVLVTVIKAEKTSIWVKQGAVLVNDSTSIAALKANLVAKDVVSLAKFFSDITLSGGIDLETNQPLPNIDNPYLDSITVTTIDTTNGFDITLTLNPTSKLYFSNGQKTITSSIAYGPVEVVATGNSKDHVNGILIENLLNQMIPSLSPTITDLLSQALFNNPNMTVAKLQNAINALANPQVNGLVNGSYSEWLNSITVTNTSDLAFNSETLTLNGMASVKYMFTQDLMINLDQIYPILPPNLTIGTTSIPISTIIAAQVLPEQLWVVKNDYVVFGQKFNNSKTSFNIKNHEGKNKAFLQAFSTTVIDINMPGTIQKVWEGLNFIAWGVIGNLYKSFLPNVFYSVKEINSYYVSNTPMSILDLNLDNYNSNLYYGIDVNKSITDDSLQELKIELKNLTQKQNIPGKELTYGDPWDLKRWTFNKTQNVLNFDLNSISHNLFNVTPNSNGQTVPLIISYDNIEIMQPISIFGIAIPEISFQTLKVSTPFYVYNGNTSGVMMQNTWIL